MAADIGGVLQLSPARHKSTPRLNSVADWQEWISKGGKPKREWLKENGLRERSPPCGFPVLSLGRAAAGLAARRCAKCLCLLCVSAAQPGGPPGHSRQPSITLQICLWSTWLGAGFCCSS